MSREEQLKQLVLKRLLAKAIISQIVIPMMDEEDEFQLIEIEGELLSEMIVRERR